MFTPGRNLFLFVVLNIDNGATVILAAGLAHPVGPLSRAALGAGNQPWQD